METVAPKTDQRVIACNLSEATSAAAKGSLAYLLRRQGERVKVILRSRGSLCEIWVPLKQLANFRIANLPNEHPAYDRVVGVADPRLFRRATLSNVPGMEPRTSTVLNDTPLTQ